MSGIAEAPSALRKYVGYAMSTALSLLAAGLLTCQLVIWLKPLSPTLSLVEQFAVHLASVAATGLLVALLLRHWIHAAIFALLVLCLAWPVLAAQRSVATVSDDRRL